MDIQQPIDYAKMLSDLISRRLHLVAQRNEIEVELVKVRQLILAIFPLLPDGKQKEGYEGMIEQIEAENSGLQDAVKLVFSVHRDEWLAPSDIRSYLDEMGFDLKRYQANPLSSISTTLRRMVPAYLESDTRDSGTVYRRKPTGVNPAEDAMRRALERKKK